MDPWTGTFLEWDYLNAPYPYNKITGWADVGDMEVPPPDWIGKKKKAVYPIDMPEAFKMIQPEAMYQGNSNACTVYSTVYGCTLQYLYKNLTFGLGPVTLHEAILKQRYPNAEYDPNKSVSYLETLDYLKEHKYIRSWRKIQNTLEDWKIKLVQNHPILVTLNEPHLTHAICVYGYDGDSFYYHDSMSPKKPFKMLNSLEYVAESYILFVG